MRRALFAAALLLCFIASALGVGAFARSVYDPLLMVTLGADCTFEYTPRANSEYALYVFSADGSKLHASAEILDREQVIASGEGMGEICAARLVAGASYTVRVSGAENAIAEVARKTRSRCFEQALPASEGEPFGKLIAGAYDAHWYSFEARQSGKLMLTLSPEEAGLSLCAMLFDEAGSLIESFEQLPGGACMLVIDTQIGEGYRLRVSAVDDKTGYYTLAMGRSSAPGSVEAPRFDAERYELSCSHTLDLSRSLQGEALLWTSDDPSIASVNAEGRVSALRTGTVTIRAHSITSQACTTLEVYTEPLTGIELLGERIYLSEGDAADVQLLFHPENASNRRVKFIIDDESVAQISEEGVVTGMNAGETELTVLADAGHMASIPIIVREAAPRYRALLVGEQSYPFASDNLRKGSEESVQALEALLTSARGASAPYVVTTRIDLSRAELIHEIRACFAGASERDVSLFYINCHGYYEGGMSFFELSDGATLNVRELERELRAVPGTIIVLLDCCGSGGALGRGDPFDPVESFVGATIHGSKYKLLTSAAYDQDSYRIAFNEELQQGVMVTAFVRALCDGAGWDIDNERRAPMAADENFDGIISFAELSRYTKSRVDWYMQLASSLTGEHYTQSVQAYPEGDPFTFYTGRR